MLSGCAMESTTEIKHHTLRNSKMPFSKMQPPSVCVPAVATAVLTPTDSIVNSKDNNTFGVLRGVSMFENPLTRNRIAEFCGKLHAASIAASHLYQMLVCNPFRENIKKKTHRLSYAIASDADYVPCFSSRNGVCEP